MLKERGKAMQEPFTINLPKITEKKLLARYDTMLQKAIEKAFEDQELYKPMLRMSGLCRWLDVSTTTIVKWQKAGMPHIVVDGVTPTINTKSENGYNNMKEEILCGISATDLISLLECCQMSLVSILVQEEIGRKKRWNV